MALVAAYSFDESGGTVIDYSGNGNSFPLTADATRVVGHGSAGFALQSAATTPLHLPAIGETDLRTVMAWVKGTFTADSWVIEWHVDSIDSGAWGIVYLQGKIGVSARNQQTQAFAKIAWPADSAWHHVAGTFDGSEVNLYFDGVLVDSVSLETPIRIDSNAPTLLGLSDAVEVDDLRIYDTALDQTAVNAAKDAVVTAPDYTKSAQLAVDAAFISRVTVSVAHYAVETGTGFLAAPTANQTDKARYVLSQAVLQDPTGFGTRFAWAVAADASIDGTVDDATILAKVASVWNLFAGVPV